MKTIIESSNGNLYSFDSIPLEVHNTDVVVTSNPVENGTPISDHAYTNPKTINLTIAVSNIMLSSYELFTTYNDSNTRPTQALELLESWLNGKELLTVQNNLETSDNMLITGLTYTRSNSNEENLEVTLNLQEMRFATAVTEVLDIDDDYDLLTASAYVNNGSNEGVESNDAELDTAEEIMGAGLSIAGGVAGAVAGAKAGAALGGLLGSVVPGLGNAVGAAVGGVIGGIGGAIIGSGAGKFIGRALGRAVDGAIAWFKSSSLEDNPNV